MKSEENPCFGCVEPKRHLYCHGRCPDEKKYKEKLEAEKEKIRKAKAEDREVTEYRETKHERLKSWDRKGKH